MENNSYLMLRDIAVIVVASTVAVRFFSMLKLPLLLGFIVVGILLYPVFGLIKNAENISQLGELGVMFMMFYIGLEFNLERLKRVFAPSFFGILMQIIVMGILGIFSAHLMGLNLMNGIFLGGVLAMSSTIVIVEIFVSRGDLNKYYAQVAIGILILEDLFAVFLLVALSDMALQGRPEVSELFRSSLLLFTFVIAIFVAGKLFIPYILKKYALSRNQQELVMLTFCLILGIGELAVFANLSLPLGAFLAGAIISGTVVSSKIEQMSAPFRNLFVALFFVSIGMLIEPMSLITLWKPILLISLAVVVFQTLACFAGIVIGGATCKDAYLAAINKAQIGEFSFVIAALGISLGVIDKSIMTIALGVSFVTVFVNPFLSHHAHLVIDFFNRYTPRFVESALQRYRAFVIRVSMDVSGNQKLISIFGKVLGIVVYALLINALFVVAVWLCSLAGNIGKWAQFIICACAFAAAIPLALGILKRFGVNVFVFGKFDNYVESRFVNVVKRHLENADYRKRDLMISSVRKTHKWAVDFDEIEVSELSVAAGKTVGELAIRKLTGAEIAAIKRGRFIIYNVMANTQIFPDDVLVLIGSRAEISAASQMLLKQDVDASENSDASKIPINITALRVLESSALVGIALRDADFSNSYGVRVISLRNVWSEHAHRPTPEEVFSPLEHMLVLGSPENVDRIKTDFCAAEIELKEF